MKSSLKNTTLFVFIAFSPKAFADEFFGLAAPCEVQVGVFGLDERLSFRDNHEGANASLMAAWTPRMALSHGIVTGAYLGAAAMEDTKGSFLSIRAQAALAYWGLSCAYYPEIAYGSENWLTDNGGPNPVFSFNNHFRLLPGLTGYAWLDDVLGRVDSWVLGYSKVENKKSSAQMISLGVRLQLLP